MLRRGISIHAPRVGSDMLHRDDAVCGEVFQSTLPVWGATAVKTSISGALAISIHAPRVGSDPNAQGTITRADLFQSTLPVWGATSLRLAMFPKSSFQSTLPVWGATPFSAGLWCWDGNFNPRSPCGERLVIVCKRQKIIHFNPRSPCGERPAGCPTNGQYNYISIHAPRVGSDDIQGVLEIFVTISIHAPRVGSDGPP